MTMYDFKTQFDISTYIGEVNDGTIVTVPDDAMSPKQILERFVRRMPVAATTKSTGYVNDDIDNPLPYQGQEFDRMDFEQDLLEQKKAKL